MGELYEAEDLELREHVALKTILSTIANDERSIQLFKREVHLARQVTHPNVCRIYDVFRHRAAAVRQPGDEVVFLAMELLSGETLAERLHRVGAFTTAEVLPIATDGRWPGGRASRWRRASRLQEPQRHARGGDRGRGTRVVVTDFGLARRSHAMTPPFLAVDDRRDEISGTPAYMAPEQVEGGPVTPATDVYAFGVVLYELVTGVLPFVADTPMRTAIKRLQEPPPSPARPRPRLDPRWEATILRCLAREPADRFTNVADAAAALEGPAVEPAAAARTPAPWTRRRSGCRWPLGRVLAVAAAGYAWYAAERTRGHHLNRGAAVRDHEHDPEQDYLSDGISEALISRLSELPGIKVVANSSSSRYKGQKPDLREVARALDVAAILAGKVVERGDSLTISVELINGTDRTHLWGDQYVRKTADLMQVPEEISRDLAAKLQVASAGWRSAADGDVGSRQSQSLRTAAQGPFSSREGEH